MSFTRQQEPLGLGHAVWCAREIVGNEPFALLLPDMIMRGEPGCMKGMIDLYSQSGGNIIAVEECEPDQAHKYGIVGVGERVGDGFRITEMVEKPAKGTAPSNFFINGRYILQPEIFSILENQERGAGNEIQLTDGMLKLLKSQDFAGYRVPRRDLRLWRQGWLHPCERRLCARARRHPPGRRSPVQGARCEAAVSSG